MTIESEKAIEEKRDEKRREEKRREKKRRKENFGGRIHYRDLISTSTYVHI